MIAFQTSIAVDRPLEQVFAYVSDPVNFPAWNSAVLVVRPTAAGSSDVGSTYSMERQLPTGRAINKLEIVAREHPHEFAIRTIEGPTPFLYRYRFVAAGDRTVIQLDAQVELNAARPSGSGRAAAAMAAARPFGFVSRRRRRGRSRSSGGRSWPSPCACLRRRRWR